MKITIKVEEQGKRGRWKLCQSCVNRTETVHGTLRFLYLSHLLYGICVKIFIMNRYISKSYTTSKNTIDRQYTEQVQL